jgi:hypothetical protein
MAYLIGRQVVWTAGDLPKHNRLQRLEIRDCQLTNLVEERKVRDRLAHGEIGSKFKELIIV